MKVRTVSLVFVLLLWSTPRLEGQQEAGSFAEAKYLTAAQVSAEALTVPLYLDPARVRLQVVEERWPVGAAGQLRLLRVEVSSMDHWHSYRVVEVTEQTLRLGGFSSPEVQKLAAALSALPVLERSRFIALALGEGSEESTLLVDSLHDSTQLGALGSDPVRWPADTVVRLPGGETLVRLTTIETQRAAYSPFSLLRQVCLVFDTRNILASWYMRVGEPLPHRPPKVRK